MHYLTIESPGEWDVKHTDDCPTVDFGGYYDYSCDVGRHLAEWGLDIFSDDPSKLEKGVYPIEVWSHRYWTDYGWEYDGGLRIADEKTTTHNS